VGNPYIGAFIGCVIGYLFAWSGAWLTIWKLFGGSNQLMAGLALLLVSIYLARVKKPTKFNLGPAVFMILTCEGALIWTAYSLFKALIAKTPVVAGLLAEYPAVGLTLTAIFGIIGVILIILGAIVSYDGFKALARAWRAPPEKEEAKT
jgi:carbon starvation protein